MNALDHFVKVESKQVLQSQVESRINQLENEMSINSEQTNTSSENVEEIENVTSTNAEIINSTTVDSSVNTTVENNVLQ